MKPCILCTDLTIRRIRKRYPLCRACEEKARLIRDKKNKGLYPKHHKLTTKMQVVMTPTE